MHNEALWLDGPGREPRIGTAELYEPGEGELLIKVYKLGASLSLVCSCSDIKTRLWPFPSSQESGRSKKALSVFRLNTPL
jgi:hypothetical protein